MVDGLHSNFSTTMNIYGHMLDGHGEKVASAIGASYQRVLTEHAKLNAGPSVPEAELPSASPSQGTVAAKSAPASPSLKVVT